jgi:hypothetical protein
MSEAGHAEFRRMAHDDEPFSAMRIYNAMRKLDPSARRMVETLQFYADPTHYVISGIVEPPTSPIKADGGRRAREALSAINH